MIDHSDFKLVKFIHTLKKLFYRKKIIRSKKDNITIYPYRLVRKIMKLKRILNYCLKYKASCVNYGKDCYKYRSVCKLAKNYKQTFIQKVRRVFSYYFSTLFAYTINPSHLKKNKNFKKRSVFFYKRPFK